MDSSTSFCDNSMEHQKSQAEDLRSSFGEYNTDKSQSIGLARTFVIKRNLKKEVDDVQISSVHLHMIVSTRAHVKISFVSQPLASNPSRNAVPEIVHLEATSLNRR